MVFIVVPTFREPNHVRSLLRALSTQSDRRFELAVVNASPGDATSELLQSNPLGLPVTEVVARKNDFWTRSVSKGIEFCLPRLCEASAIVLMNCDVVVPDNFVDQLHVDLDAYPGELTCYAAEAGGSYVTSGVFMRSWVLSLTRHEPVRRRAEDKRIPVHYLAGRTLVIPAQIVASIGLPDWRMLPHYGSDYEYSRRAAGHGFRLRVSTAVTVTSDVENTGARATNPSLTLANRFRLLSSRRSPSNLLYRSRFVWLTYPPLARIPGLVSALGKTVLEILFGYFLYKLVSSGHLVEKNVEP